MKFEVPIIYRGQDTYIIEADSMEKAKLEAMKMFYDCAPAALVQGDFEEIEKIGEIKII